MALAGAIALPLQLCQILQLNGGRAAPHRGRVRRVGRPASHVYHLPPVAYAHSTLHCLHL